MYLIQLQNSAKRKRQTWSPNTQTHQKVMHKLGPETRREKRTQNNEAIHSGLKLIPEMLPVINKELLWQTFVIHNYRELCTQTSQKTEEKIMTVYFCVFLFDRCVVYLKWLWIKHIQMCFNSPTKAHWTMFYCVRPTKCKMHWKSPEWEIQMTNKLCKTMVHKTTCTKLTLICLRNWTFDRLIAAIHE